MAEQDQGAWVRCERSASSSSIKQMGIWNNHTATLAGLMAMPPPGIRFTCSLALTRPNTWLVASDEFSFN